MAQLLDTKPQLTEQIDDFDAICAVVQLYIDGASKGDRAKLEKAFHPDARMFGHVSGTRYDVPIQDLFAMPAGDAGSYRGRIVSVSQTGDAAVATVAEDGYWGALSFVDYFTLCRIEGTWKIVSKTFAHTGGEMPPS